MVAGGLTERVSVDKVVSFSFPSCGTLPPPVVMVQKVSFRYAPDKVGAESIHTGLSPDKEACCYVQNIYT